jgi:hypothetical protein
MYMKQLLVLFLISMGHAAMVNADLKGVQDTGSANLPAFSFILLTDCGNPSAIVFLSNNDTGQSVPGATMFIIRTDSAYRILNRSATDDEGKGVIGVPGKLQYLNDLYVLRIEKNGYRSKEVQFTFWNCDDVVREYSEYSQPENASVANETPLAGEDVPSESNLSEINIREPPLPPTSLSEPPAGNPGNPPAPQPLCASLLVLAGLAFSATAGMPE